MAAVTICGCKRSSFQDSPPSPSTPSSSSSSKKLRSASSHSSPLTPTSSHFNPFASPPPLRDLNLNVPNTTQVLEETLEECGNDLDIAINRLKKLQLGSSNKDFHTHQPLHCLAPGDENFAPSDNLLSQDNLPKDGSEWVALLVREISNASSTDDAEVRASRILELLETVIHSRACAAAEQNFQKENRVLKEQTDALVRVNTVLKRAVAIQNERQKNYDEQRKELKHLKQLVSQFRAQLKTLKVSNYTLAVHLKQAHPCTSSIPVRFLPDPDVF